MIDIHGTLIALSKYRPVFHSEADFQHALAWAIHQQLPSAQVRLELPFRTDQRTVHLDLWISSGSASFAIELKYKTCSLSLEIQDEMFSLSNHAAQDLGRYDFVKDIQRLEQIVANKPNVTGYAIMLTNDASYWASPRGAHTIDSAFRLSHGRILSKALTWGAGASVGTMRGREMPISLAHEYIVNWSDYSNVPTSRNNVFRFVVVSV